MAETKTINLEVKTNAESVKKQFAEAKRELQEMAAAFGENSTQAIKAAEKAAKLKDVIDDSAEAIKNLQGGGAFSALSNSLGGVASGFTAVQGAMGLVGVESEKVQETLLKVQSAMALSEGLRGLEDLGRSFGALKGVIAQTAIGQKLLNAAQVVGATVMKALNLVMKANPIFLIIAGITAAIAAFKYFSSSTETATENNERLNDSLERQEKQLERNSAKLKQSGENRLKILVAQGASEQTIHDQTLKNLNTEEKARQKNVDFLKSKLDEKRSILKKAYEDEDEDLIKSVKKEISETRGKYSELIGQKKNNITNIRVEEIAYKRKVKEDEEEKTAKEKEENKKRIADNKAKLKKIAEDNKQEAEKNKKELIDNANALNEALAESDAARLKQKQDLAAADEKMRADGLEKLKENARAQLKINEEEAAAAKQLQDQKIQSVFDTLTIISNLAELFAGKSRKQQEIAFKVQKAANIAATLIETYLGAQKAYTSQIIPLDPTSVVRGALAAAVVVTSGLLNVKKIASTQFNSQSAGGAGGVSAPSGGGGGGGGAGGGAGNVITPNFNIVGNNGTNQLTQLKQAPIQAYVVSGEMSSQQSLDRNRLRNATL